MKLNLREKRPPGNWIETFVKDSPFPALCDPEVQSEFLSNSSEFKLLVANKRTLITSLAESVKYDEAAAEENERSCLKAWAVAVFEQAGGVAAARAAAAAAGPEPSDANLDQAVTPLICFAGLVYSVAYEVDWKRKRKPGYLAAEVVAAAAATLTTQGDAHPGPFWNPLDPEIVADYPMAAGAELSDVYCIAVLARCAMVLATCGGALMPVMGFSDPRKGLLVSLVEVVMIPVKFVRAAAATAPPHSSLEARAIWQFGMGAAAHLMVYGKSERCWPRQWDDEEEDYGSEEEEEEECSADPALLSKLANFFAAYLGALGSFCNHDVKEHPWSLLLWDRALPFALWAHQDDPLTASPARIKSSPGLEYFLKGALPPGAQSSRRPCLPTDALSLRGLAYILLVRQNYEYGARLGDLCFATMLQDAGVSEDYVLMVGNMLDEAATCVVASLYRTMCQVGELDAMVESGLLDVLLDRKIDCMLPTGSFYHEEMEESSFTDAQDAAFQRPGLVASILARLTSTEDGRKLVEERALNVLMHFIGRVSIRLHPNGTCQRAIDTGHATHFLTLIANTVNPACLALTNLLADKPMSHSDAEPMFQKAVYFALSISKKLDFDGFDCSDQEKELLAAIHRSTLGLAVAALEGGHIFGRHWNTDEGHARALMLYKIIDECKFNVSDTSKILELIGLSSNPVKNCWLHRHYDFSNESGIVAAPPGEGFPYTPIPLFSSCAAIIGLILRMQRVDCSYDDRDHATAKEAIELLLDANYDATQTPKGKPWYERYRKAVPVACLSWAMAHQLSYYRHTNRHDAIAALAQAVDALRVLWCERDTSKLPDPSEAVAWDANEEAGFGEDPESVQRTSFKSLMMNWAYMIHYSLSSEILKTHSKVKADEVQLGALVEDVETVHKAVEKFHCCVETWLRDHGDERRRQGFAYVVDYIHLELRQPFSDLFCDVKETLENLRARIMAAVAASEAAAAALLSEDKREVHVADLQRRLKRQRQKEKQRAAKEGERAQREAAEAARAAKKAEKERLQAEAERLKAEEERKEAERQAERERIAAERAAAKAAREAAAAAAAQAEKERKLAEKREKKAQKRAEKLAARAEAEAQARAEAEAAARAEAEKAEAAARAEAAALQQQQAENAGPRPGVAAAIAAARAAEQQLHMTGPRPGVAAAIAAAAARETAMRQPLSPLPLQPQQQQAAPAPTPPANDLADLLGVLLPIEISADQENRAPNSAAAAAAQQVPKSPAKLPGALGPLARDPVRWAAFVAAISCPLNGTVFDEPVLLTDGQTYEKEAVGRLGPEAAAGARPNLTMRALSPQTPLRPMATDDIHTPFAGGAPADERPPRNIYMHKMSREPSGNVTGVFLGGHFDEVLPSAPSLDEMLLQITQGVPQDRPPPAPGMLPSMPSRLFTMSVGKSLSAMASLDLGWLGDGATAAQQAAAGATAGVSTLPEASPMPPYLPSRTVAPDSMGVNLPGTPTPMQAAPLPPQPPPMALPYSTTPAAGMDAVHAALMEAQAAYWRALEAHAAGQGLQQPPGVPSAPSPTPQVDPNLQWALQQAFVAVMAQQGQQQSPFNHPPHSPTPPPPASAAPHAAAPFVPFSQPQTSSAAVPFPVYVPTDIPPPRTAYEARADAMAQWARERATMAAMTGSDMESAMCTMADAMSTPEGWSGGGGLGAGPGAPSPGTGRIIGGGCAPTVHLTRAQPIKVACVSPSPSQPKSSQ